MGIRDRCIVSLMLILGIIVIRVDFEYGMLLYLEVPKYRGGFE